MSASLPSGSHSRAVPAAVGLEPRVRAALAERFGDSVRIDDTLGAVSVVGTGINATFANVRRGSQALSDAGMAQRLKATSSFRITWMIDRSVIAKAVRLLHGAFIELHTPSRS